MSFCRSIETHAPPNLEKYLGFLGHSHERNGSSKILKSHDLLGQIRLPFYQSDGQLNLAYTATSAVYQPQRPTLHCSTLYLLNSCSLLTVFPQLVPVSPSHPGPGPSLIPKFLRTVGFLQVSLPHQSTTATHHSWETTFSPDSL